jgi:hypothetical protein
MARAGCAPPSASHTCARQSHVCSNEVPRCNSCPLERSECKEPGVHLPIAKVPFAPLQADPAGGTVPFLATHELNETYIRQTKEWEAPCAVVSRLGTVLSTSANNANGTGVPTVAWPTRLARRTDDNKAASVLMAMTRSLAEAKYFQNEGGPHRTQTASTPLLCERAAARRPLKHEFHMKCTELLDTTACTGNVERKRKQRCAVGLVAL